jgi:cation diffusion facilitator family transporter
MDDDLPTAALDKIPGGGASDSDSGSGKSESGLTVIIAFGANLLVALAKTAAAILTGSASMVAEAAHSWADTGNEIFLIVANRRAARGPDPQHPLGFGRESYFWSLFAALGLFAAGAAVSVTHGISQLRHSEPSEHFLVAYIVLALAFVLEGTSFRQAFMQVHREAGPADRDILEHALFTSDPTLRAVFAEDAAALIGLVLAFLGVLAHQLTGSVVPDAIGSIAIGVLLGVVAIILVDRNRRFLLGQEATGRLREGAIAALEALPDIARITYLRLEYVGPRQVYFIAAVDVTGDEREHSLAVTLRRLERQLETHPAVVQAILTLSADDEPSITA